MNKEMINEFIKTYNKSNSKDILEIKPGYISGSVYLYKMNKGEDNLHLFSKIAIDLALDNKVIKPKDLNKQPAVLFLSLEKGVQSSIIRYIEEIKNTHDYDINNIYVYEDVQDFYFIEDYVFTIDTSMYADNIEIYALIVNTDQSINVENFSKIAHDYNIPIIINQLSNPYFDIYNYDCLLSADEEYIKQLISDEFSSSVESLYITL